MSDDEVPPMSGSDEPVPDTGSEAFLKQLQVHSPTSSRYSLKGEVARGGMGVILKVWDNDLRRHLAMKIVLGRAPERIGGSTPPLDERTLGRFLDEAQVTGQLDHPGVVPVHELGVDDNQNVYFTMRLVKGDDLKAVFDKVRTASDDWTVTRALNAVLRACEALAYAHDKGVIHRDIKPANIMVGRFGEVYVMDWGLARARGREDRHDLRVRPATESTLESVHTFRRDEAEGTPNSPLVTMDGAVIGTPSYMSPEQAIGATDALGPRSDVYSMGAILYELLGHRMPFVTPGQRISPHTVLARLLDGPPTPLRELNPGAPAELIAITEKAMARSPDDRYADMNELAEDLRAYLEGRVVRAHQTGAVVELRKWVGRNRGLSTASLLAVFILIAGTITAWLLYLQSESNASDARYQAGQASARAADAEAAAQLADERAVEARRQSYFASIRSASMFLDRGDREQSRRSLLACPEELRGWEWHHFMLRASPAPPRVLGGADGDINDIAVSPDLTQVATAGADGWVRVWETSSAQQTVMPIRHFVEANVVAFSPDGTQLVSGGEDGVVMVWDARTGELVHRLAFPNANLDQELSVTDDFVTAVQVSADGASLIASAFHQIGDLTHGGVVRVWNLQDGLLVDEKEFPLQLTDPISTVQAVSRVGRLVATGYSRGGVLVFDREDIDDVLSLEGVQGSVASLCFTPDGKLLIAGGGAEDKGIHVWELSSGRELVVMQGHGTAVTSLAVAADGRRLVSGGGTADASVRLWDMESWRQLDAFRGQAGSIAPVAIAPDGSTLLSIGASGGVEAWDVRGRSGMVTLTGAGGNLHRVAVSLDGGLLAAGSTTGGHRVWDTVSGDMTIAENSPVGIIRDIAFSQDGHFVVVASERGSTVVFDSSTGGFVRHLVESRGAANSVSLSADGRRVAVGLENGSTRILEWDTGDVVGEVAGEDPVQRVVYFPDGERLFTVTMSAGGMSSRIFDLIADDEPIALQGLAEPPIDGCVSSDGAMLATISFEQRDIRLWDSHTGQPLVVLAGHQGTLNAIAFSPDCTRLASAAGDHSVRLWEIPEGRDLALLHTQGSIVSGLSFSPDGARLYGTTEAGDVLVWETAEASMSRMLEGRATREAIEPLVEGLMGAETGLVEMIEEIELASGLSDDEKRAAKVMATVRRSIVDDELWTRSERDRARKGGPRDRWLVQWKATKAWAAVSSPRPDDVSLKDAYDSAYEDAWDAASSPFDNSEYDMIYGVALFRLEYYADAVWSLQSMQRRNETQRSLETSVAVIGLLFIAMSQHRLGEEGQALSAFGEAMDLIDRSPESAFSTKRAQEIQAFLEEARTMLRLDEHTVDPIDTR